MRIDGGQAFPHWSGWREGDIQEVESKDGMTLRDYFATHAPAREIDAIKVISQTTTYKARYKWADAMLAERDKS